MTREDMERIDAALDGSIGPEDFEILQQTMREDPTVFRHYRQQAGLHGQLEWELREVEASRTAPVPSPSRRPRWPWVAACAAFVTLGAMGTLALMRGGPSGTRAPSSPSATTSAPPATVARLDSVADAVWADLARGPDERLLPGDYELRAGSVTLVFDSGATLALKGPARLHIESARQAALLSGHAAVEIPDQAAGFLLETPTAALSDQDTRFVVAVGPHGVTELRVLEGVLGLTPKFGDLSPILVRSDRPVSVDPQEVLQAAPGPVADGKFPPLPVAGDGPEPGFVHWSFDRAVSSTLDHTAFPDLGAKRPGDPAYPARVQTRSLESSTALIPGRFGNAIQLSGEGGFVSTSLPGIPGHQARTVAFWVRVPPDASPSQSYSIVSWGSKKTGAKWQIGWNPGADSQGTIGAIRTEVEGGFCIGSTDLRDGRWHHVASVFLGGDNALPGTHIRHYVDGRLETTTAARNVPVDTRSQGPGALPVSVGRRIETDEHGTFRGLIDEVYLFPEALTPQHIERLHRDNRVSGER